ncbi:Uncharacterised protein [Bacteroides xylanisolvens]|nr:Uncharacterised protein [Bacteroides xylanisolvens]DAF00497.1 MAG TPA: hypothetical protein [Caudoviricetes sp.]DAZ37835.1 MAG TPA: hypothetical protein [Caudoviricetes sp.]
MNWGEKTGQRNVMPYLIRQITEQVIRYMNLSFLCSVLENRLDANRMRKRAKEYRIT